jgi:hypothetical protein
LYGEIGAEVGPEFIVDGDDLAVAVEPHADLVDLLAVMAARDEMLAAALHPLYRPAEPPRQGGHQHFLVVRLRLGAEGPANVRRDDPDLLLGHPENFGDHLANVVGALCGRHHDQLAGAAFLIRQYSARLDRHAGRARMAKAFAHHFAGVFHRGAGVADRPAGDVGNVVRPAFVHHLRRVDCRVGRSHCRQDVVVHLYSIERVRQPARILGDNDGYGLSDVTGGLRDENLLVADPKAPWEPVRRDRSMDFGEIPRAEDPEHARKASGLGRPYFCHPRAGVRTAHYPQVHHPWPDEIVQVSAGAEQQRLIFLAAGRLSNQEKNLWNSSLCFFAACH